MHWRVSNYLKSPLFCIESRVGRGRRVERSFAIGRSANVNVSTCGNLAEISGLTSRREAGGGRDGENQAEQEAAAGSEERKTKGTRASSGSLLVSIPQDIKRLGI